MVTNLTGTDQKSISLRLLRELRAAMKIMHAARNCFVNLTRVSREQLRGDKDEQLYHLPKVADKC